VRPETASSTRTSADSAKAGTSATELARRYPTKQLARVRIGKLNRKMMTIISGEEYEELMSLVEIVDGLPDVPGSEVAAITPPPPSSA
jgi:hypothetical protein